MKRFGFVMGMYLAALFLVPSPAFAAQEVKPFISGSFQKILSARQGKPFIINFWSLSCGYCMAELEMLKKLANKYPKLDLVLVSTDTLEEEKELVSDTVTKLSLGKAEAWMFADSYTERLRFEVDKQWQGELPRTYFFDAKGKVSVISGKVEQKEVEQWIKEQYIHTGIILLREPALGPRGARHPHVLNVRSGACAPGFPNAGPLATISVAMYSTH